MLSAALRRNAGNSAFQNLQKCLLYAFTGYVSGDGRVFRLPCDLIDFIDVDDTAFRFVDIIVGSLDQAQENVFDVFADIAGFGQVVASEIAKGTSRKRASVWARSVLPLPVGPSMMILDFWSSTSSSVDSYWILL